MSLRRLEAGGALDVARGDAVVVIPLFGAHDLFVRCLRSVLAHTPASVPVLIADDHGPEPASLRWVEELDARGALQHDVVWARRDTNLGFVANCNAAFAQTAPADVVLLNSDIEVAEGWLEGMLDAARSDTTIASATALANDATILSVPHRNAPVPALPQELSLAEAARRVRDASPRLRPRLPTAIGHCCLLRRSALDLVGGFDEAFAPAYSEEVDWSQKCVLRGLQHVAADDVLVLHHGRGSLNVKGERNPLQLAHDALIAQRYPYYEGWVDAVKADEDSPLARSVHAASRALLGLSVTIDGRCLSGPLVGTQVHTLEFLDALHATGEVRLRVLMPDHPNPEAEARVRALGDVQVVPESLLHTAAVGTDAIVHRLFQITAADQLVDLLSLGRRVIVSQLDLIAFRNPGYFPGDAPWLQYRQLTGEALAWADRTLFSTDHARTDALTDGLLPAGRAVTVPIGADHVSLGDGRRPQGLPDDGRPFLLCLGTDFRHKNRLFALELLEALVAEQDWDGRLVLAGATVAHGSSAGDEAAWLSLRPELADRVVVLPATGDAERDWLYANAAAVVYPSTYEGFGFVPFEAAAAGTPCLFAHQTSIAETLRDAEALLVPWDASASAAGVIEVLRDPARADALVAQVRTATEGLTWAACARRTLAVYEEAVADEPRDAALLERARLVSDAGYWTLRAQIGDTGMALVGPEGALLPDDVQNVVAGLARRSATRTPLLGALRALKHLSPASGRSASSSDGDG